MRSRSAGTELCGILVGAGLGFVAIGSARPTAAPPPAVVRQVRDVREVPCRSGLPGAGVEWTATAERVAELEEEAVAVGALPLPWPEGTPAALRPEAFTATLEAATPEEAVDVVELDCSEYPCLLVFRGDMSPRLAARLFPDGLRMAQADGLNVFVPVGPGPEDPDDERRIEVRMTARLRYEW